MYSYSPFENNSISRPVPSCSKAGWRDPPDKSLSSVDKTNYAIHWIVLYPVDSGQPLFKQPAADHFCNFCGFASAD